MTLLEDTGAGKPSDKCGLKLMRLLLRGSKYAMLVWRVLQNRMIDVPHLHDGGVLESEYMHKGKTRVIWILLNM